MCLARGPFQSPSIEVVSRPLPLRCRCSRSLDEADQLTCFVRFISFGNLRNQDESNSSSSIS
jgi:hypothetical protein